jgi:pilus assembly protein CpaB
MGHQANWQRELSRRWLALQQRRAPVDDRAGPRRSAVIMLLAAGVLGLAALYLGRGLTQAGAARKGAVATVPVVVAAADIGFGEALTPDKLTISQWPAGALPSGSFSRIDALSAGTARAALRPIAAGEIVIASALAGGSARLAAAPLLGVDRRAMAVPVSEVSGVSGLVYPGDRVDVFFTRQPEEAMMYGELVAQNVRVLAVGADMNVGKDKPEIVRAVTLEVTALQAQKLALAITTGQLSLALRRFGDEQRVRLDTVQLLDLNDGTRTRLVARPQAGGDPARTAPAPVAGAGRPAAASAGTVIVMRGMETSVAPVSSP